MPRTATNLNTAEALLAAYARLDEPERQRFSDMLKGAHAYAQATQQKEVQSEAGKKAHVTRRKNEQQQTPPAGETPKAKAAGENQ